MDGEIAAMNFNFNGTPDTGMDWMEFVSSLVGSLAWPTLLLIVFLIFKRPLTDFIDNIKEAKWGDGTVTIDRKLDKAEQTGRQVMEATFAGGRPAVYGNVVPEWDEDRFAKLMKVAPGAAVVEAWGQIEGAMRELGVKHQVPNAVLAKSANDIAKELMSRGVIQLELFKWLLAMRQIRNAAAHNKEVTETDAYRFLELAEKVRQVLKHL